MFDTPNTPTPHAVENASTAGDTRHRQSVVPCIPRAPDNFATEFFRHDVKAEVESLLWCIADALRRYTGIRCEWEPFVYDCLDANDPKERWGCATIEITGENGKSATLYLAVVEMNGTRVYDLDLDETPLFDKVSLHENVAEIFRALAAGVWKQLS